MSVVYVAAYCDPQCERLAVEGLAEQDYWPYMPTERYYSKRLHKVAERPLFSRYIFVGLDREARLRAGKEAYRPIVGTRGVRDILKHGDGSPGLINAALIEELRNAEQSGLFDAVKNSRLKEGAKVMVEGSMSGFIGKVVSTSSKNRVSVLFEMLGREVVTSVPLGLIRSV
jgi:transcription antitermination factor NusG